VDPEPVWALCRSGEYQSTVPARSLVTTVTELPLPRPCLKAPQYDRTGDGVRTATLFVDRRGQLDGY